MKKILIFASMLAAGLWISGVVLAGEYHTGTTLNCNECHTMHYSQQHTYGGTVGTNSPWGGSGPYPRLLRDNGTDLCLACHDGQTAIPDVSGADANTTGNGERAAGTLTTGTAPYQDYKGHTLTTSSVTPPGGSSLTTFSCASCHDPHGGSSYRNLKTAVSYTTSTTAANTNAIRINLAAVPAVGSRITGNFYSADYIYDNEPAAGDSQYGDFCASCHGNFHGTTNTLTASPFQRHPTEDVNFTTDILAQYTSKTNRVRVLTASNAGTPATTSTPSCQSCHKAHGNQNPFGLIYMTGTGTRTEQGTAAGTPRDLCTQCHTQGG